MLSASHLQVEEIYLTETIRASIPEVFRAMVTAKIVDDWGGGPARIQARVNGKYSLWDGDMHGIIKEIEYPRHLVYTLREESWDPSCLDSLVSWELGEGEFGTQISLHHSGLPTRKIREMHLEGWGEYYLGPLKAFLERVAYRRIK